MYSYALQVKLQLSSGVFAGYLLEENWSLPKSQYTTFFSFLCPTHHVVFFDCMLPPELGST